MAAKDRRKGDPMSGKDDKSTRGKKKKPDRKPAADKTVVQIGAQKPADWQAAEESTDVQQDSVETLTLDPADLETPWPETAPVHNESVFEEETETPRDAATDPVSNEPDKTVISAKHQDTAKPQEDSREPEQKSTSEDVPDQSNGDTVEPLAAPSDQQSDLDAEPVPNEEPRIEVPVQQQYASLLAALSARIEKHPGGHDLLAVLRMLEGQTAPGAQAPAGMDPKKKADEPAPPRIGKSRRSMEDIVRFGQDPSSEYAPSTIERATRDADGGLVLLERFLGMLGPHGALPAAYTDEAIMRGLRGEDSFPRFLDVFNNRFVQLFYRAWADARPIVQHDRPDDDRFLAYLGAPIGIGSPIFRDLDHIDDRLKLLYAGLTSAKTKSAARLKALITGVFGVDVEIDQCVGTWLHLDKDDQLSLGGFGPGGAGQLGADTIVGAKVYSVSDKIRIRIFTSSLEEYRKFLPPTRTKPNLWTEKLFDLIDFYLGLEIEYEIELALPKRCASAVQMNSSSSATLGHIGWLKPPSSEETDEEEFEFEDEEMLTDTRFRPVRRHTTVYQ